MRLRLRSGGREFSLLVILWGELAVKERGVMEVVVELDAYGFDVM